MDRPILFSGPMVRALLVGRKTQTRRVSKKQDWPEAIVRRYPQQRSGVPYAPGDRLWVREAWRAWWEYNEFPPSKIPSGADVQYVADEPLSPWDTRFRQGIHMPRWASRLTLTVTDVRVQRLQETTVEDAVAEGALSTADVDQFARIHALPMYQAIWDGLNAERGFGWSTNPWVVAVSFSVEHRNIDAGASNAR